MQFCPGQAVENARSDHHDQHGIERVVDLSSSRPNFSPWPVAFLGGLLCLLFERLAFPLACAAFCARAAVGPSRAAFPSAHLRPFHPRVAVFAPPPSTSAPRPSTLRPLTNFLHALIFIRRTVTCPSTSLTTGFRKHGSPRPGVLPSSCPLFILSSSTNYWCPSAAHKSNVCTQPNVYLSTIHKS